MATVMVVMVVVIVVIVEVVVVIVEVVVVIVEVVVIMMGGSCRGGGGDYCMINTAGGGLFLPQKIILQVL